MNLTELLQAIADAIRTKSNKMPVKGDIITMDLGTTAVAGTNNTYRVLKMNGAQAFVVAMYDYNTSTAFNTSSVTTTFTDSSGTTLTGQKYEGSNLDTVLNTTFYGAMNDTAKAAIIPQNINQTIWKYNSGSSTDFDYAQEYNWEGTYDYYQNKGSVSVGERYVFALDMTDLADYFDNKTVTSNQLMQLFYNQDKPTTITRPWLRSALADISSYCCYVYSSYGYVDSDGYGLSLAVRPAFVIDLSKVDFTKNTKINAQDFPTAIKNIKSNAEPSKTVIPAIIKQTVLPSEDYDAMSEVVVDTIPYSEVNNSGGGITALIAASTSLPTKGDVITLNLGTTAASGVNNTYKVLKTNGSQALVMAMYDYTTATQFNTESVTTTFTDSTGTTSTGQKYEDSNLDTLLNTTFYGAMNTTMKTLIIPQNITQTIWKWNSGSSTSFDYAQEQNWKGTYRYHQNKGSVAIGNRYVFALDMTDVAEYFDGKTATSNELMQLFYNQNTPTTYTTPMLRSADVDGSESIWFISAATGNVNSGNINGSRPVRPAFVIDLSKLECTINKKI